MPGLQAPGNTLRDATIPAIGILDDLWKPEG